MHIQVLGRSLPFPLAAAHDPHDLTSRAALPADSPAPPEPSSLLPLLTLTLVFVLVAFALTRLFKRFTPGLGLGFRLPNYPWLRGKGQGAKGRLGLGGVELLPTSVKSIPTPSPSPRVGLFAGSSNVGKDSITSGLLSRSSSFDTLPQYPDTATLPPTVSFPVHGRHVSNPFKFSIFPASKSRNRGKSTSHRRSRSLGVPFRHLSVPSSPLASINGGSSAPTTPSPQALLIDFSSSTESTSSGDSSDTALSKGPSSSSSDLGTHRFSPGSDGPLIPIPLPGHHVAPASTAHVWAFDLDMGDDPEMQPTGPFMQVFKRSQDQSASKHASEAPLIIYDSSSPPTRSATLPTPALLSSSLSHNSDSSHTPSTAEFPLTPPGLSAFVRVCGHVGITTLESSLIRSDAFPSPISSDIQLASVTSHLPVSPILQEPNETLVDLETTVDRSIELVNNVGQLVDFDEDAVTVDDKVQTQSVPQYNAEEDIGTTTLVPTNLTSLIVQDSCHLVTLREPTNCGPPECLPQFSTSNEPISVTVEPPTPMPSIELPLIDTTTLEPKVPEISDIPNSRPSLPLHGDQLVESVQGPVPDSGQVSPVGAMEAWSWDDPWNFGLEHEVHLPERQTTEVDGSNRLFVIPQPITEDIDAAADESVDEEAWFMEEVTIVCPEEEQVDSIGAVQEKMSQEIDLTPEPKPSIHPTHLLESDLLMRQNLGASRTLEVGNRDHDQEENNEVHDNFMSMTLLDPLSIPLITISAEEIPDPDLLPLPRSISPTHKPPNSTLSEARPHPSQTPTPPASPPASPSRSLPTTALSSPNTTSPVALTPSITSTPTSIRPAWSLRASDAPALGLPSPSSLKQRSSPDLRLRIRLLSDVVQAEEQTLISTIHLPSDAISVSHSSDEVSARKNDEAQIESTKVSEQVPETIVRELSTALPGSFPVSQPSVATSDFPTPSVLSTALTSTATPRRRSTRSPLDIALAMQLRPGLGLGADPAWMVRFLMSMFGWFAILLSGQAEFDGYRNGSYPIGH
ncbi:hypothetical protein BDZ94DRAFT_1259327 [Collybia nuda]|uniref:Transmembrane protein n=1 Tax=Collybia nuda TaxID=64659 RepID=A0A9P6CJU0_9AGAR|nr:hypothetical protein BDZ94DRAFT_1259327 [Collybia nuda]